MPVGKFSTSLIVISLIITMSTSHLDSLEERRQILCLKFAKNGIKNNNLNDLFPENDKTHKMKTRAVEKYKVQHANTERFKKSSIIAMQKMLNHDTRT